MTIDEISKNIEEVLFYIDELSEKEKKTIVEHYFGKYLSNNDEITDSIGIVTKADFLHDFKKEFVDEHFEELARAWFKGMAGQVDFGMILDNVKEEFPEGVK